MRTLMVAVAVVLFSASLDARIWTDSTGKYRIEAEFVTLEGDTVHLRRPDGQGIAIPLERLSPADQAYAKQQAAPAAEDAAAQPPPSPSEPAAAGDVGDLDDLVGARIHIQLNSGEVLKDVEVLAVRQGKYPGSLTSVTIRGSAEGQKSTLGAGGITQLKRTDGACHLVYIPNAKALMPPGSEVPEPVEPVIAKKVTAEPEPIVEEPAPEIVPEEMTEAERQAFYKETGVLLWSELTDEQQLEMVQGQKSFLHKVSEHFKPTKMLLFERERFFFLTDFPNEQALIYVPQLEEMYKTLCNIFGVSERKSVWRGKAVIVAFAREADRDKFFQTFYSNRFSVAGGQAHTLNPGDGTVIIVGYYDHSPLHFARVLMHEMCHGFVQVYKSRQKIPGWLEEGAAYWISTNAIAQGDVEHARLMENSMRKLMMSSWELDAEFFTSAVLEVGLHDHAYRLTNYLLSRNRSAYKELIDRIKMGETWEQSLRKAYSLSPEDLVRACGEADGMPGLHLAPDWREVAKVKVFVSYDCKHDEDLKELLDREIEKYDLNCAVTGWSTVHDDSAAWKQRTQGKIRDVQLVIVLCGEHTHEAGGVAAEVQISQEEGIPYVLLFGGKPNGTTKPANTKESDTFQQWSRYNLQLLIDRRSLKNRKNLERM